jgi:hypothetical protein
MTILPPHWEAATQQLRDAGYRGAYVPLIAAAILPLDLGHTRYDGEDTSLADPAYFMGQWRERGSKLDAYLHEANGSWRLQIRYGPEPREYVTVSVDQDRAAALYEVAYVPPPKENAALPDVQELARVLFCVLFDQLAGRDWLTMLERNRELAQNGSDPVAIRDHVDDAYCMSTALERLCGFPVAYFDADHAQYREVSRLLYDTWQVTNRNYLTAGPHGEGVVVMRSTGILEPYSMEFGDLPPVARVVNYDLANLPQTELTA